MNCSIGIGLPKIRAIYAACLLLAFSSSAFVAPRASATTWTDGTGDFLTPGNWDSGLPNLTTDFTITTAAPLSSTAAGRAATASSAPRRARAAACWWGP